MRSAYGQHPKSCKPHAYCTRKISRAQQCERSKSRATGPHMSGNHGVRARGFAVRKRSDQHNRCNERYAPERFLNIARKQLHEAHGACGPSRPVQEHTCLSQCHKKCFIICRTPPLRLDEQFIAKLGVRYPASHELKQPRKTSSSRQTIAHMTAVPWSFGQAIIVCSDCGVLRPLEVQEEPPIDDQPDRNIGNSEGVADDARSRAHQMPIKLADLLRDLSPPLLDEPWIVP